MTEDAAALRDLLDQRLGDTHTVDVAAMAGGGSCDVFSVGRAEHRWVLRRAPTFASSATAHNVLREFRILDAIKDQPVPIARPILACDDPAVFGAPFYVMERIDGVPIRSGLPAAWAQVPQLQGSILEQLVDALAAIHAVDWDGCGLADLAHPERYLQRQIQRWQAQLASYDGRGLPVAAELAAWLESHRPPDPPLALTHGDYKLDNVLVSLDLPPRLLAVVDWEMASIGDPLVDLAWAMIFHPGPEGTMRLGMAKQPTFAQEHLPSRDALVARYAAASGRDVSDLAWYDVFARWKLAVVLEGSYAKFLRGESSKPVHEYFGQQVDLLLSSGAGIAEQGGVR